MKAEVCELQKSYGEIRIFPENTDDLWHLEHLIRPGDLVFGTTLRSVEQVPDKLRPEKLQKRPVRLGIRVERVEPDPNGGRFRVHGLIEHGADAGSYHTLNIEPGYEVSVIRSWSRIDLGRIERAVAAALYDHVHILTIEEGEATLFRMRQYGPEQVVTLRAGSGKGGEGDVRSGFFMDVAQHLAQVNGPLIVAGPGFVKDDFVKFMKGIPEVHPKSLLVAETRRTGAGAARDVIGLGLIDRITGDVQLSREVCLLDELLAEISRSGPVAYGREEVARAVEYGSAERVLVTDNLIGDPGIKRILDQAETRNAQIIVFSTRFDPGKQLGGLGGIAAFLRFRLA
jgi:protein pelota